jgi:hypothetical protein
VGAKDRRGIEKGRGEEMEGMLDIRVQLLMVDIEDNKHMYN